VLFTGDGGAHQVDEVVGVEPLADVVGPVAEALLEALDRAAATLDVRVVGVEQAAPRAGLVDDPADVLGGVRRDAHLALDVLAGPERQLLQPFLVAGERVDRRLHLRIHDGTQMRPCSMTPMRRSGNRSSTPSKIIVASVCIGGNGDAM
jgi:hypothetical protein